MSCTHRTHLLRDVIHGVEFFLIEGIDCTAEVAFHLRCPVVAECAQICLTKGQQTVGDVVL